MALGPVTLNTYLTTDRTFDKWVVNSSGALAAVGSGSIAIDHNPSTNESLGMLIEGAATNQFPDSTNMTDAAVVTTGTMSVAFQEASLAAAGTGYIGADFTGLTSWNKVAITFFVYTDNTGPIAPVPGFAVDGGTTVAIEVNGGELNVLGTDMEIDGPFSDGTYRVRI